MSNEDNDRERDGMGVALPVATAVIIAVATTLFTGVGMVRKKATMQTAPAASAAVSATAVAEQVASALEGKAVPEAMGASAAIMPPVAESGMPTDGAHVEVVDGVVRFYFAVGKADVAAGAKEALVEAVTAAKAGKMLVLSGFHDSTGSAAINAELAKKRAFAVRDALLAEGVAESSITLQKPEAMPNTHGSDPNARRVDVVIQ